MTNDNDNDVKDNCDTTPQMIPPSELEKYRVEHDPHSEQDIADYVHGEAPDETVQNVERIKQEVVLGNKYEIWDVITDKDRWWVITNLTNIYSQKHFISLDYTLTFHIGLMMRLRNRSVRADSDNPTPFEEVFRRREQVAYYHDRAVEAEDYQAVGMQLRECLLSLVATLRRRVYTESDTERPRDADFVAWSGILMDIICSGNKNKKLRQHLKNTAKETWQLVNWLTHDNGAGKAAASIAIDACRHNYWTLCEYSGTGADGPD